MNPLRTAAVVQVYTVNSAVSLFDELCRGANSVLLPWSFLALGWVRLPGQGGPAAVQGQAACHGPEAPGDRFWARRLRRLWAWLGPLRTGQLAWEVPDPKGSHLAALSC